MPVVVRKSDTKREKSRPSEQSRSVSGDGPRVIPPAVFITVVVLVVVIVGVIAYRMFGPGENWDNSKEGAPPSVSSLAAPPQVKRSGDAGTSDQGGASQDSVGTELPPDVR